MNFVSSDSSIEPLKKRRRRNKNESKTFFLESWSMSHFSLMKIFNSLTYDQSQLSIHVRTFLNVFNLFFDEITFLKIVKHINEFAKLNSTIFIEKNFQRFWKSFISSELRNYLTTCIWMKLHKKFKIENYWCIDVTKTSAHMQISKHINLIRWQQIKRHFYISKSLFSENVIQNRLNVFEKLKSLNKRLRVRFKKYWKSNMHLIVDETIQRFMNRARKMINISKKSELENFKMWILFNFDYILNWMFD